jgi:parallel beta-helix repeat protein
VVCLKRAMSIGLVMCAAAFVGRASPADAAAPTHRIVIPVVTVSGRGVSALPLDLPTKDIAPPPAQPTAPPPAQPTAPPPAQPTATPPAQPTAPPPAQPTATPPAPRSAPVPECRETLASLIGRSPAGAVVSAPACIYREAVVVDKPLTLVAEPGAEIRGSDVWTDGWVREGAYWVHGEVPSFATDAPCREGTSRCLWREQVFVDESPLTQVAGSPRPGEFAIDARRRILLADDPRGRLVEVTTRERWLSTEADGVTVRGFRMRHAASRPQDGAISNDGRSDWTLENSVLSDAHGAVVDVSNAGNVKLLRNEIARGGQEGVHGAGLRSAVIQGNTVHTNNTEAFDEGWEAGGLKITASSNVVVDGNEVYGNLGPGIWFDFDNRDVTISNNRVHHNTGEGIFYEISFGGTRIFGNKVWECGWPGDWGYGAGILIASSSGVEVFDNVVAWSARGISVISQDRGGPDGVWSRVQDVVVHDNTIVGSREAGAGLGWYQDFDGALFAPSANNRGYGNRFALDRSEPAHGLFVWIDYIDSLADFNRTPGEEGGRYVSTDERTSTLTAAAIPLSRG